MNTSSNQKGYLFNTQQKATTSSEPNYKLGTQIIAKVAGVTFEGRQAVVAALEIGEKIILRRDPTNPYDTNAIRVERQSGEQIGYIDKYKASSLSSVFDAHGEPVNGTVLKLTGGFSIGMSLGLIINFTIPDPGQIAKGGND